MASRPPLLDLIRQGLPALEKESASMSGATRTCWFEGREGKVYLRVSRRAFDGQAGLVPVVDLANVEVAAPFRGRGVFRELLAALEEQAAALGRGIFVENVFSETLEAALHRYGYHRLDHFGNVCFWKPLDMGSRPSPPPVRRRSP